MNIEGKRYPGVGVAVIVLKEGKVLVGKRMSGTGNGTWCLPGGKLEFGESWEECARRELKEETGLEVENLSFAYVTNDITPEYNNTHYITIFMKGEYAGGEVSVNEPDKIAEFQWSEWESIPEPRFIPLANLFKAGYKPF
ncbi:MAG: NUDIX domain-containing protein [Candidatus Liptonbacteria bacterium]|nr:NUDIX domain-containing protein [Candidatus Liptonbacteria bacterium]